MTLKMLLTGPMTTYRNGWIPARPLPKPLLWRIKDAWEVLMGRAEALYWPEEEP